MNKKLCVVVVNLHGGPIPWTNWVKTYGPYSYMKKATKVRNALRKKYEARYSEPYNSDRFEFKILTMREYNAELSKS